MTIADFAASAVDDPAAAAKWLGVGESDVRSLLLVVGALRRKEAEQAAAKGLKFPPPPPPSESDLEDYAL